MIKVPEWFQKYKGAGPLQDCIKYNTGKKKYNLKVTGCSKQLSLFKPEICQKCLEDYMSHRVQEIPYGPKPLAADIGDSLAVDIGSQTDTDNLQMKEV